MNLWNVLYHVGIAVIGMSGAAIMATALLKARAKDAGAPEEVYRAQVVDLLFLVNFWLGGIASVLWFRLW